MPTDKVKKRQIRAYVRRGTMSKETARQKVGGKHIDDWDLQELAHGQPRDARGQFNHEPFWLDEQTKQEATRRFRAALGEMFFPIGIRAVECLDEIIRDEENSARVRLDASKFVVEHILGKAKQEIQANLDLNVQQILAQVVVDDEGIPAMPGVEAALPTGTPEQPEQDWSAEPLNNNNRYINDDPHFWDKPIEDDMAVEGIEDAVIVDDMA